jgi:hypothetical protein
MASPLSPPETSLYYNASLAKRQAGKTGQTPLPGIAGAAAPGGSVRAFSVPENTA